MKSTLGRLYESFPPARLVSGLVPDDLQRGFLIANIGLVTFAVWCFLWPIRHSWRSATALAWLWVFVELINGVGHPLWSLRSGGYTPGVVTAPILFLLAALLAAELTKRG